MGEVKEFNTKLASINNAYLPMITRQMENNNITFTDYQKKCVLNAIGSINQMLDKSGISWNDTALDPSNITQILFNVASLELNSVAQPRECYFQIRNEAYKGADGKTAWKKKIEMGIEGDGNDAILSRFGRDVEKVYPYWLVRENDIFEYPKFNGLEMSPPKWEPRYTGKVVRVVYPILHKDKTIHFYIAEREDVKKNLLAHINNNMMNETFGICADRYKASAEQLKRIADKKKAIKTKANAMTLDEIIMDDEFEPFLSPSWKEDYAREEMIIRKMRNNITKKIPKDFGSSVVQETYMEATDESYRNAKENIIEHTATVLIEDNSTPEPEIDGKSEPIPVERVDSRPTEQDSQMGLFDTDKRVKPNFD